MKDFVEPATFQEAEERMRRLYEDAALIEAQLGNKFKLDENGEKLSTREYYQWREKAKFAWSAKRAEYKALKEWIAEKGKELTQKTKEQNHYLYARRSDLLRNANQIIQSALRWGYEPNAEEQGIIDAIRIELQNRRLTSGSTLTGGGSPVEGDADKLSSAVTPAGR